MKPGVHYDYPELEYRQLQALNASTIKALRRSPLHAWYALANPSPRTAAMTLGSAVHLALLEPERYKVEHAVGPSYDRRTKVWKEWEASAKKPLLLTADEAVKVEKIKDQIESGNHEVAYQLLRASKGRSEVTSIWQDEEIGTLCKARADRVCIYEDEPVIVELKTARDASAIGFRSACRQYGYDLAAAWYLRGFRFTGKTEPQRLIFVVVENEPPFGVACYSLQYMHLASAEAQCIVFGEIYVECMRTGVWPGYSSEIQEMMI